MGNWTRHPNYFGEIIIQFGIYMIAVSPAANGYVRGQAYKALYATILGPFFLTLLLMFVWLDTSRTTWSKEAIREEQPLGGILSLLEPYEHFDSIPTTIFETAHDPQANHLPRVSDLCF